MLLQIEGLLEAAMFQVQRRVRRHMFKLAPSASTAPWSPPYANMDGFQ